MLGRVDHQKDQSLIRCLDLIQFSVLPPPPFSRGGRRAGDKVSDQSCLGGWSLHKNNKITGFRGLLGAWTHGGDGRALRPDTLWKSLSPFPTPCPGHLLHLALSDLDPFITNWWSSMCNGSLSFMSCSNKWIEPEGGGSLGKPQSRASESKAQGTTWTCVWKWSWGGVSGVMEPLTCGIWCFLQEDSVGTELNCRTFCWCQASQGALVVTNPPTNAGDARDAG